LQQIKIKRFSTRGRPTAREEWNLRFSYFSITRGRLGRTWVRRTPVRHVLWMLLLSFALETVKWRHTELWTHQLRHFRQNLKEITFEAVAHVTAW